MCTKENVPLLCLKRNESYLGIPEEWPSGSNDHGSANTYRVDPATFPHKRFILPMAIPMWLHRKRIESFSHRRSAGF